MRQNRHQHTLLAMAPNDQWDYGDRPNEHLTLRNSAKQPGACAVHFGGQISSNQIQQQHVLRHY